MINLRELIFFAYGYTQYMSVSSSLVIINIENLFLPLTPWRPAAGDNKDPIWHGTGNNPICYHKRIAFNPDWNSCSREVRVLFVCTTHARMIDTGEYAYKASNHIPGKPISYSLLSQNH